MGTRVAFKNRLSEIVHTLEHIAMVLRSGEASMIGLHCPHHMFPEFIDQYRDGWFVIHDSDVNAVEKRLKLYRALLSRVS